MIRLPLYSDFFSLHKRFWLHFCLFETKMKEAGVKGSCREGGGRLCEVSSWGEPDLRVAAHITLSKIPGRIQL